MRHLAIIFMAAILGALPAAAADQWRIIPERSTLQVVFKQGGKDITGRFRRFDGTIAFSPDDLQHSQATINVDLSSFESGDGSRDSQARRFAFPLPSSSALPAVVTRCSSPRRC